ncbi:MAG: phosphocholine cytidylyltransferase family protein [Candidatus Omnitrophica bacterium]|nr:phosphocholine cytidylyltransferase family protein [Candidatus Omnitrophota bacterium]
MKGVILAAGRGSRLKGFTEDCPKCLNKVGNTTLLACQLAALNVDKIKEIILVTGYRAATLETFGYKTYHNPIWADTNMVSSLLCAKVEFNDALVVSYSDIIYEQNIVQKLVQQTEDIVVVYDRNWQSLWEQRFDNPLDDAESFIIDETGRIKDIGRKGCSLSDIQGQYTGLLRFSPKALTWIVEYTNHLTKEVLYKLDMTTLLRSLIEQGYPIFGMPISGGWCEIDTTTDLTLANRMFEEGNLLAIS